MVRPDAYPRGDQVKYWTQQKRLFRDKRSGLFDITSTTEKCYITLAEDYK